MSQRRYTYVIPRLTRTEYETLIWIADRGYDAGILKIAGVRKEYSDGGARLGALSEPDAWQFRENVESDSHAFLTSSSSRGLNEKLRHLFEKIV